MNKMHILLLYFLVTSCSQKNMIYGEHNDKPFGYTEKKQGIVNYKFKLVNGGYCLQNIILLTTNKNFNNSSFDDTYYFYDERRKNFDLLSDDPRFEIFFGSKNDYLYNYEATNSSYNLRNSILLLNNKTLSPYYSTQNVYLSKKEPTLSTLIVSFNFSGDINFYYNASTWFEKDLEFYKLNLIDTVKDCVKPNFMASSNLAVLNKCDSVWPLSEKQINKLLFMKSEIDSIPYGISY